MKRRQLYKQVETNLTLGIGTNIRIFYILFPLLNVHNHRHYQIQVSKHCQRDDMSHHCYQQTGNGYNVYWV